MRNTVNIDVLDAQLTNADIADMNTLEEVQHMIYNVIDIGPGMDYDPGEEVIAVIEADSAAAAVAAVMAQVGFTSAVIATDPDGYAEHVLAHVEAVPA